MFYCNIAEYSRLSRDQQHERRWTRSALFVFVYTTPLHFFFQCIYAMWSNQVSFLYLSLYKTVLRERSWRAFGVANMAANTSWELLMFFLPISFFFQLILFKFWPVYQMLDPHVFPLANIIWDIAISVCSSFVTEKSTLTCHLLSNENFIDRPEGSKVYTNVSDIKYFFFFITKRSFLYSHMNLDKIFLKISLFFFFFC
jgi:hypothetical protein